MAGTFVGTNLRDVEFTNDYDYLYGLDGNDVLGTDRFGYDYVEGDAGTITSSCTAQIPPPGAPFTVATATILYSSPAGP
jgi:hypothetical protein